MADALNPVLAGALRLHLAELTPRQRMLAVEAVGGVERIAHAHASDLRPRLQEEAAARLARVSRDHLEAEIERAGRRDVALVTRFDDSYPPRLRECSDPPWMLWVRGRLPDPQRHVLAVVGARRTSAYGLHVTRRLVFELAERGVVIVSGGARGVDGLAHQCALDAGTPTVAVLGCGADVAYPHEHRELFDAVARCGAVVSEHPCGTQPRPYHFPVRNRILAAWAPAVLVTEASPLSGSLITARLANEANRDVLAVPGPITSTLSEGTNALIVDGAVVVTSVDVVLEELGMAGGPAGSGDEACEIPDADDPLLAMLPPGISLSVDELAASGLKPADLLGALVRLEARGRVQALPGGLWMRSLVDRQSRGRRR